MKMVTEEELAKMGPEELAEFQKRNCVFCQIAAGKVPARTVYSDEHCMAVLDINPATKGHMLLMPKEHFSVMPQVPEFLLEHIFMVSKGLSQCALKAFQCKGSTIFVANGVAAGQRAPHFMVHIIPRYDNDGLPLTIPRKEVPRNETDAIAAVLKKALGQKAAEAEVVKEEKKEQKAATAAEKEKTSPKPATKKKSSTKKAKESETEKFDLDKISEMLGNG